MNHDYLIIGDGGHARVLIDTVDTLGYSFSGCITLEQQSEFLKQADFSQHMFINGVGSVGDPSARAAAYETYSRLGAEFPVIIHPSAVVSRQTSLGSGVQIFAGSVLQSGVQVGVNSIVNTRASIDHDSILGAHVHIAPGAILCGDVSVGDFSHIGCGAVVLQGVSIGSGCIVGAGAVVFKDVKAGDTVVGIPARRVDK